MRVYAVIRDKENQDGYIVMKDYAKDLRTYLFDNKHLLSFPNISELGHGVYIFLKLLYGLTELEVTHRDIKPENYLVEDRDGQLEIVLADFGIISNSAPLIASRFTGT